MVYFRVVIKRETSSIKRLNGKERTKEVLHSTTTTTTTTTYYIIIDRYIYYFNFLFSWELEQFTLEMR